MEPYEGLDGRRLHPLDRVLGQLSLEALVQQLEQHLGSAAGLADANALCSELIPCAHKSHHDLIGKIAFVLHAPDL